MGNGNQFEGPKEGTIVYEQAFHVGKTEPPTPSSSTSLNNYHVPGPEEGAGHSGEQWLSGIVRATEPVLQNVNSVDPHNAAISTIGMILWTKHSVLKILVKCKCIPLAKGKVLTITCGSRA